MYMNRLLVILPLALTLSGCVIAIGDGDGDWDDNYKSSSDWQDEEKTNRDNIANLILGQLHSEVINQMGNPTFSEAFKNDNGNSYQILYYRTHRSHEDGKTTKDETTALVFEGDKLIGWGNDALQRIR